MTFGFRPGSWEWSARGACYRLRIHKVSKGLVLLALPERHWCADWRAEAPPPDAGWLAEHGFSGGQWADCEAVAELLANIWRTDSADGIPRIGGRVIH